MERREKLEDPKKLADDHWDYVSDLINLMFTMMAFHYKSAMIHGYKHGYEEGTKDKRKEERDGPGKDIP